MYFIHTLIQQSSVAKFTNTLHCWHMTSKQETSQAGTFHFCVKPNLNLKETVKFPWI